MTPDRDIACMTDTTYTRRMSPAALMTAEELLRLNIEDKRTELVRGVLYVREPAGYQHGDVAMQFALIVGGYVRQHKLGRTFAAETGFTLQRDPDTVRAADVAFIANERLLDRNTRGFAEIAPDLVVEVLSPDARPGEVLAKVADWLNAGCKLVWILDPIRSMGRAYRADGTEALLGADDAFDGEDVLPGFACPLSEVLQ